MIQGTPLEYPLHPNSKGGFNPQEKRLFAQVIFSVVANTHCLTVCGSWCDWRGPAYSGTVALSDLILSYQKVLLE